MVERLLKLEDILVDYGPLLESAVTRVYRIAYELTSVRFHRAFILDIKVRIHLVDMDAGLVAVRRKAKYPDDGDLWQGGVV